MIQSLFSRLIFYFILIEIDFIIYSQSVCPPFEVTLEDTVENLEDKLSEQLPEGTKVKIDVEINEEKVSPFSKH